MPHDLDNLSRVMDEVIEQMVTGAGSLRDRLTEAGHRIGREVNLLNLSEAPAKYQDTILPVVDGKLGDEREQERLARNLLRIRDDVVKSLGR